MRSVTEFPTHKLVQGLNARNALTGEGKTPEEVSVALGESFKLEGDKLKYFLNAVDVASQNLEKLSRVRVLSFAEGESVPHKAVKVEELHYLPEFQVEYRPKTEDTSAQKGGPGGKKGGRGGRDSKGKGGPRGKGGPGGDKKGASGGRSAAGADATKN